MQEEPLCRFCLESAQTKQNPLLDPCGCKGSMQYVHYLCLQRWRFQNPRKNAEICLLCFEPYFFPYERDLERLPSEKGAVSFCLRFPVVLTAFSTYSTLLQFSLESSTVSFSSVFIGHQYGAQCIFLSFAWSQWHVRNRTLYWAHWKRPFGLLIVFLYVGSLVGLSQHEFLWILPLNLVMATLWPYHCKILADINQEQFPLSR